MFQLFYVFYLFNLLRIDVTRYNLGFAESLTEKLFTKK